MAASEQKAYEAIRRAITEGTYANGMHLRAAGLADRPRHQPHPGS